MTPAAADASDPDAEAGPGRLPKHFELLVAAIIVVLGGSFAVAVPALAGYDEGLHFLRAWQLSDGGVFPRERTVDGQRLAGGDVPAAMYADLVTIEKDGLFRPGHAGDVFDHLGDPTPGGESHYVEFNSSAIYPPIPYLPAALAIRIGRVLGLSTLAMILLARFAQLLVYAALIALAVRRIPRRKVVLAVCALAPVALVQAGTINADALTTALVLLTVAEAFRLATDPPERIRAPQLVEAAAVLGALALAKAPYVLVAAFFVVPIWRHRGRIARVLAVELGLAVVVGALWGKWAQDRYIPPTGTLRQGYAYVNVAPNQQLAFARTHPFSFLAAVGRTLQHSSGALTRDTFTQAPAWTAGIALVVFTIVILVVSVLVDAPAVPGGALTRTLAIVIAVGLAFATFLAAYAGWNALRAPRIDAVQGRYFFPIVAIVLIAAIPAIRTRLANLRYVPALLGATVFASLAVTYGVAKYFYA